MSPDAPHLVYFADPMCSWCYGFSPVISRIIEAHGDRLPVRLIMGGMRPYTKEPWPESTFRTARSHWQHVAEATGQPFDFGFFSWKNFLYDTEPASRAVVLARRTGMAEAFAFLKRSQRAFYAENRDTTNAQVLADLAAELGYDRDQFLADFESDALKNETRTDFAIAQRAGISGFPTLIAGANADGNYSILTQGYQAPERILPAIDKWLKSVTPGGRIETPQRGSTEATPASSST